MAHELIHTCPGCFDHGKKWKKYASVARERLGYLISRTVSPEDLGIADISQEEPRYKITCNGCIFFPFFAMVETSGTGMYQLMGHYHPNVFFLSLIHI